MSKSKMKKKVVEAQKKNQPETKNTDKKWIKPKDFKFLPPVKFLPGFRSAQHWKRIVAMTYYCITPVSLFFKFMDFQYFGIFLFVMLLALPFMICSLITFLQTKDKYYAVEAIIAAAVLGADNILLVYFMQQMIEMLPK